MDQNLMSGEGTSTLAKIVGTSLVACAGVGGLVGSVVLNGDTMPLFIRKSTTHHVAAPLLLLLAGPDPRPPKKAA